MGGGDSENTTTGWEGGTANRGACSKPTAAFGSPVREFGSRARFAALASSVGLVGLAESAAGVIFLLLFFPMKFLGPEA